MKITVNNKLCIVGDELELFKIRQYCKENLVLDNPDFYKLERMGKWTGNTPKTMRLYEQDSDKLYLPFGCLHDIYELYPDAGLYDLQICPLRPVMYYSNINLYPYQEKAVKRALSARNGIIVMPCGAGKTQTALEIIARIGAKTLWLTHTQDLLTQSMNRAKAVLGRLQCGTITAGKVNIGNGITFATVQTMAKLDISEYKNTWDVIVVDECQHAVGSPTKVMQFYKVVNNLSARYKYGLTATPKRSDGLEQSMFALLGGIIHVVSKEAVKDTTCPIKVIPVQTNYMPSDIDVVLAGDGTLNYASLVDDLINDGERYELVLSQLRRLIQPTIVLANRVEYLQRLCDDYNRYQYGNAVCLSGRSQSKAAKAERKKALQALNNGELDCIFATYQLAKEGLDVPNLGYVVFATPEKDETTIIQSAGRVGRKADGKEYGVVIDFVDEFAMFRKWYRQRLKSYKKIEAEVEDYEG